MGKSVYGDSSRLRTGVRTEIVVNPQLPLPVGGGSGSGSGSGSGTGSGSGSGTGTGSNIQQPPAYFINGATDALKRLINKTTTKMQINTMLENYRRIIALETNTQYVPTVISSVAVGVSTNEQDGKLAITTVSAEGPKGQSEVVIR